MKKYKIEFNYNSEIVTLDLRRVVAIGRPNDHHAFRIYFENAIWVVIDSEYDKVYKAWVAI